MTMQSLPGGASAPISTYAAACPKTQKPLHNRDFFGGYPRVSKPAKPMQINGEHSHGPHPPNFTRDPTFFSAVYGKNLSLYTRVC